MKIGVVVGLQCSLIENGAKNTISSAVAVCVALWTDTTLEKTNAYGFSRAENLLKALQRTCKPNSHDSCNLFSDLYQTADCIIQRP